MIRQYIGARYVPIIDGEYNSEKVYEPLTIVTYNGSSYTSKKTVPAGTLPTNTEYWALTGNYNAQVAELSERINNASLIYETAERNGDLELTSENASSVTAYEYSEFKGVEVLANNHAANTIRIVTSNNPTQNYLYDSAHNMDMDLAIKVFDFYNSLGADLIGAQELSQLPYNKLTDLLKMGNIKDTFASNVFTPDATFYSNNSWRTYSPALYSNTTLVGKTEHTYEDSGSDELRMYLKGTTTLFGKSVTIYNTHLTHISSEVRTAQLSELSVALSADTSDIVIVTGDFNMDYTVEPESFAPLTSGGFVAMNTSLPTYPRDVATKVIDNVFVRGNATKVREGTIATVPSGLEAIDHRAYYVDIQI